ncbi:MAG TPA: mannitol dehydrogenase family protein [Microlunatus sp.]|nr:mannitol dehydrogenase family protein [Microlunatus sp.]
MSTDHLPRLDRSLTGTAAAPIRIVHLGLGNFHRAHQAWYTWRSPDAASWGIAAFTGRRPDAADALGPQDGLYTVIVRDAAADTLELVGALSEVRPASDHDRYLTLLAAPETALVTITVTEAGYHFGPEGRLADSDVVAADIATLRRDRRAPVTSLPGKLVAGLLARRQAGSGPITVLSCDNLPHNGAVTRTVVADLARRVDPALSDWLDTYVDFASSMVDRITPATTDADRELVAQEQHYRDEAPVPTEPFSEWVISGRFPAGRPAWESAGAHLVDDVAPYEQRKLTLLNGSHSLLAYAGSIRGHASIDEAVADPACAQWVERFWDEAVPHLTLAGPQIADYRAALLERYRNPRIRHRLAQIAADGSTKIAVRILPTVRSERAQGRVPIGCATVLAAWILHLRGLGAPVNDTGGAAYVDAAAGELADAIAAVITRLDPELGRDQLLLDAVLTQATEVTR